MSAKEVLTCEHVMELLDEYRSNELPPDSHAAVHEHLQTCAACTAALENDRSLGNLINESIRASTEHQRAPEGISDKVREIVAASNAARPASLHRWHGIAAVLALVAFIAALSYPAIRFSQKNRERSLAYETSKRSAPDWVCLLYTSPSPRDGLLSRMPSSA